MLLQIAVIYFLIIYTSGDEDYMDINDILNEDFMPGSLLMLDGSDTSPKFSNVTSKENTSLVNTDGSYNDAMMTMGFHRKMMNEYLCRNFLADQILEEMKPVRFKRRLGYPSSNKTIKSQRRMGNVDMDEIKDSMLADPGSSNYRDWLTKTTTLEDIYRHYGLQNRGSRNDDDDDEEDDDNDLEHREHENGDFDGDVTGFAIQTRPFPRPQVQANAAKVGYSHTSYGGESKPVPAHYAPPTGHSSEVDYGHQHQPEVVPQYVHYHYSNSGGHGGGKKDMILKDLFDIALTALAFLSFGVFAVQVVLCIAATKTTTTTGAALLSLHTAGTGSSGSGHGGYHRVRRDVTDTSVINELARRVLMSMEAAIVAEQDDGNCLRRFICANNKYSRKMTDNQKIWIPVYGLALSWLSGRLSTSFAPAPAMLESLKAAILGLGNANCELLYPNCNLRSLRDERRKKKRRKRSEL